MAIAARTAGTAVGVDSGNLASVGLPTAHALNDILLCLIVANDNVACSMPAGWANLTATNNGTTCRVETWWKRDNGSESAPTVTHAAGSTARAQIYGWSGGLSTATPVVAGTPATGSGSGSGGTQTANGITPASGASAIIFAAAETVTATDGGGANVYSGWSGTNPSFAEIGDSATELTHEATLGAAWGLSGNGAATGTRTVTMTGVGTGTWSSVCVLVELLPDLGASGSQQSMMLPLTGLAIPGQPSVSPPTGPASGSDPSAFDVVTPLPVTQFAHPLSLVMAARLFPSPQPYVQPAAQTVYNDAGTGTITLSGSASETETHTSSPAGTITLSGTFTQSQTHSSSATGTVTLSGSAVENFQPPSAPTTVGYDQTPEILVQRLPH